MSQMLNNMYIIIRSCDDLQYLLSVTYIMTCTGFVFGFGDYPLSVWLLNPSIYIFSPNCERYWWPVVLYFIMRFNQIVYMYLEWKDASVELCNSFLSVNVILDMKCYVLHFIQVTL